MSKVRVPKTPKKAFDRMRRPSSLLLGQIEHLEWAVLPAAQRKPEQLPTRKVTTEAQAAERIAQLTKMVREAAAAAAARLAGVGDAPAAGVPGPVILPPLPKAAARRKRPPDGRTRRTTRSARRRRSDR